MTEKHTVTVMNSRKVTLHDGDDFDYGYEGVFVVSGPDIETALETANYDSSSVVTVYQTAVSGFDDIEGLFHVFHLTDFAVDGNKVIFDAEIQLVNEHNQLNFPEFCYLLVMSTQS